jgi:hypothetical protein
MRNLTACALTLVALHALANEPATTVNPVIDSTGYLRMATQAASHRETRRVSEEEFIRLAQRPGTVILDARSAAKYAALHVHGAVNLSFPDLTIDSLARLAPDRETLILIYCNNNFANAPDPMPTKLPAAALNLATYTALYTYGYRNVYELGPYLDVNTTRIRFDVKPRDPVKPR